MKILVFTTFFSRVAFYYFTTNKTGQISKKKDLFSQVATTIVVIFCKRSYKDTTCMTYIIHFWSYRYKVDFTRFIYLFELTKNVFFFTFL